MNVLRTIRKSESKLSAIAVFSRRFVAKQPPSYFVFDRETKKLQRNRTAYDADYKVYDYLKEEVGYRVADRIFDVKRSFDQVLDLGCQRGYVSKHLTKETVRKMYMYEMAEKLLEQAELPEKEIQIEKKVFDEEEDLPFADNSLDLVVSSLNLHWVNDLPKLFSQVMRCLKKDAPFIGAMFAGDTLFELRVSLQLAELERKGGITSRISPFTTPQDIGNLLYTAGFRLLTLDFDEIRIAYPSLFELIYDIKGMGESNCTWNRKFNLNPDLLIAAQSIYKDMYGNEDGSVPATYQVLFFIAWKPDESQQKPAKRGSGQVSLKNLGEVVNEKKEKE